MRTHCILFVIIQVCLVAHAQDIAAIRERAENGDASAQNELGRMYEDGKGVPKNDAEAVRWYRKAAEQGDALAQISLGFRYYNGEGILQDYVYAHMWSNLSSAQGNVIAKGVRDIIAELMTPQQIAEAQALAKKWSEEYKKEEE
jgi:hypothetical protein